jgi:hypothetical protein
MDGGEGVWQESKNCHWGGSKRNVGGRIKWRLTPQRFLHKQCILNQILISHRSPYHLDMARSTLNFPWFICSISIIDIIKTCLKPTLWYVRNIPNEWRIFSAFRFAEW